MICVMGTEFRNFMMVLGSKVHGKTTNRNMAPIFGLMEQNMLEISMDHCSRVKEQ